MRSLFARNKDVREGIGGSQSWRGMRSLLRRTRDLFKDLRYRPDRGTMLGNATAHHDDADIDVLTGT